MRKLVVTLMLCLVASCAGGKSKVGTANDVPKPPENPWSWIPETSTTVGRVDVEQLRKTELWPLWSEIEGEQKLASWVTTDKIARVTFGGTGQTRDNMSYVVALEGQFSPLELSSLAKRDGVQGERRGLLRVYPRPEGFWTQISPGLIVMCTPDRIDDLVARATLGDGTAVKETELWTKLATRISLENSHVAVLASDPEGKGRDLLDRQAEKLGLGTFARDALRMGLGIEIGAEYRIVAVAETADEQKADAASVQVKSALGEIANNFFVRMLGIGALMNKVRVSNDDNYVYVRGIVSEADLNNVLQRVHSALSLANGAGSLGELQ